jgi:hypothetical protein
MVKFSLLTFSVSIDKYLVIPFMHSWGSAGPEVQWAWGGGFPSKLWDQLLSGVLRGWVVGIPVVMDLAEWLSGGYPDMVWVSGLPASEAEGQVSQWCMDLVWTERQGSCCVWVWHGAVAQHSPRGREPGTMEQWV